MAASRILAVTACFEVDTPEGPQQAMVDLAQMRAHCRLERVEDLLEDLTLLCDDVQALQQADDSHRPLLTVIRGNR